MKFEFEFKFNFFILPLYDGKVAKHVNGSYKYSSTEGVNM